MRIFGREENQEERFEDGRFKDLNPENKRRRKEPLKPWGKFERLLILGVLVSTVVASGILAATSRDWKLPSLPRISIPRFNFVGEETIVIGGKSPTKESEEKSKKILSTFEKAVANLSGVYGLYVIRLSSGSRYGINEKEIFQGASLLKLPMMAALYKEVDLGSISLDTKYTLKNSDKVFGSGGLFDMPAGTTVTYEDLARLMGKESDRTAYKIVKNILGDEKVNKIMSDVGMNNTSLITGETTPYDIGIFLEKLWRGDIVSKKSKDEILSYLTNTIYENWITPGIPRDVRVSHKYSRDVHVVNDAGIVFASSPFVLVIMSKGVVEREADSIFPELAKIVYNGETSN